MATVLLLHGVGLDRTMWDQVRSTLAVDGAVSAPDLLGHGDSPAAPPDTSLADLAAHALETVEGPVHVVGFSLGAMVGQHLAVHHRDRVASLICVSSAHDRSPEQRHAVRSRLERAAEDFETGVEAAIRRWFPPERSVPAEIVERTRAVLLANDRQSYLACYRVFAEADGELAAQLPQVRVPVLAVTGELDTGSTPRMTERLATAVPHGRHHVVPEVGHMLPEERPAVLADLIGTFVKEQL